MFSAEENISSLMYSCGTSAEACSVIFPGQHKLSIVPVAGESIKRSIADGQHRSKPHGERRHGTSFPDLLQLAGKNGSVSPTNKESDNALKNILLYTHSLLLPTKLTSGWYSCYNKGYTTSSVISTNIVGGT